MSWDAYVFGDLQWPMPDPGLVAVWRAMTLDPSRWDDWAGFGSAGSGTVGELLDSIAGAKIQPGEVAPLEVIADEHGVKLRAYLEKSQAYWWQPLATAWRLAADLGASGDFVWVPGEAGPDGVAYRAEIGDGESAWRELVGAAARELEGLPGRREIDQVMNLRLAELGADLAEASAAPAAEILDDVFAAGIDSLDDMFPSVTAEAVAEAVIIVDEPAVEEPAPAKPAAKKAKPAAKPKAKAKPAAKPKAKAKPAAKAKAKPAAKAKAKPKAAAKAKPKAAAKPKKKKR